MTERLYYHDSYLQEFDATVLDTADDGRRVYLDRTAFYPTSGGQPHDLGFIADSPVIDVVDNGETIVHVVADGLIAGPVHCRIDWARRYDHMQQHTGQHLLSAVCVELLQASTLSFHMGEDVSTIELGVPQLIETDIERLERRVNEIVREARPVAISFEDATTAGGLRKPSKRAGELRLVAIAGVDKSACGGTHVRSTAELGPILIRRSERVRGNVRVEFVCGDRALASTRKDFRTVTAISGLLATSADALPSQVQALQERTAQAEKERTRLATALAGFEGRELYGNTLPDEDGIRRITLPVAAIDGSVRAKVQAFTAQGRGVALAVGDDPAGVLLAASADSGVNAGSVLKSIWASAGARGGGSAAMAQGNLPEVALLVPLRAALGFREGR